MTTKFSDLHRVAFGDCAAIHEHFTKEGVVLPVTAVEGELIDVAGFRIVQIDPDIRLNDEQAATIAEWVALCVNTCAGYRAVLPEDPAAPLDYKPEGRAS